MWDKRFEFLIAFVLIELEYLNSSQLFLSFILMNITLRFLGFIESKRSKHYKEECFFFFLFFFVGRVGGRNYCLPPHHPPSPFPLRLLLQAYTQVKSSNLLSCQNDSLIQAFSHTKKKPSIDCFWSSSVTPWALIVYKPNDKCCQATATTTQNTFIDLK